MAGIPFPHLDPVLYSFGPFLITWYEPALCALGLGAWIGYRYLQQKKTGSEPFSQDQLSGWLPFLAIFFAAAAFIFHEPLHSFSLGPLVVRWYALAYLAGFILGWRYCLYLANQNPRGPPAILFDDFLIWAVVGTVIGGRLGYILVYQPDYYLSHPFAILAVWHGGMSFHGGMLGVIGAAYLYTRRHNTRFFAFTDLLACAVPIGLFFGRLANFVNGELYGRVTTMPWGIIFPCRGGLPEDECPGPLPRHPSQIYEACLEGVTLFLILFLLQRKPQWRNRPGLLSGAFLVFYGIFRFFAEFFRMPDIQLGFILGGTTMGQLLSIPMILFGAYLLRKFRSLPASV